MQEVVRQIDVNHDEKDQYFNLADGNGNSWLNTSMNMCEGKRIDEPPTPAAGSTGPREWESMRDGQLLQPVEAAFGSSLESEQIDTGFFSLGYSPAYHTAGSVIGHVDAGTNAERSGLLAGNSLLDTIDINPAAHSFNTPIRFRIKRAGKAFYVVFDPHTKKQVPAWRWKDKLNHRHPFFESAFCSAF